MTAPALAKMFVEAVPEGPKRPAPEANCKAAHKAATTTAGKLATTGVEVLAQLQLAANLRHLHKRAQADVVVAAAMDLRPPGKVPSEDALAQRERRTGAGWKPSRCCAAATAPPRLAPWPTFLGARPCAS